MKTIQFKRAQEELQSFDLIRLTKSKSTVDICSNTLRSYHKQGLPFYRKGKAVFFSKNELTDFIRNSEKKGTQ